MSVTLALIGFAEAPILGVILAVMYTRGKFPMPVKPPSVHAD